MTSPTTRFSDRAELYGKYRPGYPAGVVEALQADAGLTSSSIVADIGSGTGISTRLLAPHVSLVYAVEPNAEMRAEAERDEPANVVSVDGTAEETGLVGAAVDFVVAATAFHWFKKAETRREFRRILKPYGLVVLLWNMRKREGSKLGEAYDKLLLEFGTDYKPALMSDKWGKPAGEFFGGPFEHRTIPNLQDFDFEGFKGRLLSASYAPLPGHEKYEPMIARLREIFDECQVDGRVRFDYDTQLYWGRI
ncbi:MAG TPA: class I SAM-dependent methyltransferase [Bryobacteraceae bacterium]|jgi:SAM-dependent methyltransferase